MKCYNGLSKHTILPNYLNASYMSFLSMCGLLYSTLPYIDKESPSLSSYVSNFGICYSLEEILKTKIHQITTTNLKLTGYLTPSSYT